MQQVMENLEKIRYLILDVDGTMTDGGVYLDSRGAEMKKFSIKDGDPPGQEGRHRVRHPHREREPVCPEAGRGACHPSRLPGSEGQEGVPSGIS